MCKGWIKLHRSIKDWEWYDDTNATRLLIHLLVTVNYEDKKWKGNTIKAGSLAFSWDTLSNELGLTKQQLRTSMAKLESSKEVTRKATNKYQVVTLCKWEKLQSTNTQVTDNPTHKQHSSNIQITPTKEVKNIKEIKKKENNTPTAFKFFQAFLDLGVDKDLLNDWLTVRKKKKATNSKTAFNGFIREVSKTKLTVSEAVRICAERNWTSFNSTWNFEKPTTENKQKKVAINFNC